MLDLRWRDIGEDAINLPDTKSGARLVPLSPAAARVLTRLPRIEGNPWVIPGTKPGRHLPDLNHYSERVRERAELDGVRLHDLRHSCASWVTNIPFLLMLFSSLKIRNQIVT